MRVRKGQIIDQLSYFKGSDKSPYLMSRYLVLGVTKGEVKLYTLKGYTHENISNHIIADISKPGDIEIIDNSYIVSREESVNSFYWEIVNEI